LPVLLIVSNILFFPILHLLFITELRHHVCVSLCTEKINVLRLSDGKWDITEYDL